jgi:hypothetical protein
MEKEELLQELENAYTVEQLIRELSKMDKNLIVINGRDKNYLPVSDIREDQVDYCYDEIISRKVVNIW